MLISGSYTAPRGSSYDHLKRATVSRLSMRWLRMCERERLLATVYVTALGVHVASCTPRGLRACSLSFAAYDSGCCALKVLGSPLVHSGRLEPIIRAVLSLPAKAGGSVIPGTAIPRGVRDAPVVLDYRARDQPDPWLNQLLTLASWSLPPARVRIRCFTEEVVGTGTGRSVARIEEPAALERETATADAPGQPVAQRLELCDATVQRAALRLG